MVSALKALHYKKSFLGNPEYQWGQSRRLHRAQIRISQFKNACLVPVKDYLNLQ
jgi:hypothetical protein